MFHKKTRVLKIGILPSLEHGSIVCLIRVPYVIVWLALHSSKFLLV
jgi:hypothetical protein